MTRINIGMGSCGIAAGAGRALEILGGQDFSPIDVCGCIGMCYLEPIVDILTENGKKTYVRVDEKAAAEIMKELKGEENCSADYLVSADELEILKKQRRIVLRNCGIINPEKIGQYGGYAAFRKAAGMMPDEVIDVIKESGLSGRGGAGFPTWFKWDAARKSPGAKKYMICNADEGDPGAFMDRAVLEGDPHSIIEGMLIGAYAVAGREAEIEGVVYVRAEYPLAVKRLETAIGQARENGLLGKNILGSGFDFDIRIKEGAGAFVCGEETALIASLEGERGMPRLKPPYPAQKGFWQAPSNINNVETYANVPWIILNGAAAFAAYGTEGSKGTKVFALTGKINRGGLVEIPMGKTIGDVIYEIGGGIKDGKRFKAVQMGGPSGGCIPESLQDTVIDYKSLAATGAIMGSGGMVVMDESTCMVDMARFFLDFTCKESCGKCVHCRIGTKRMLEILERIVAGEGREGDIELLLELGGQIREGALCQLGITAPNPVLTTIKYFRDEYEDHIYNKKCTAHSCKALVTYTVNADKCTGCGLCKRNCPVGAVSGETRKPHAIDAELCVKCGKCAEACRFGAVVTD